jgi:XTP/dITP diphosphohydrolase
MTVRLLIATTSRGKVDEFRALLAGLRLEVCALRDHDSSPPAIVEDGATYAENAVKKAVALAWWSGENALADDSGLEVDALDGAPGVRSARYAGVEHDAAANIAKLLHALRDVPERKRTARFRCVIAVARPEGASLTATGTCEGRILAVPRGSGGFGYDPVFYYDPLAKTFAELSPGEKNRISHRALACRALRPKLLPFLRT